MARDSSGRFVKGGGVTDTDHGAKALLKRLAERARVTVGVHEDEGSAEHSGGGGTIAEVMGRHELGLGVPRRSFVADYVDENRDELRGKLRTIGRAVIDGKVSSVEQALDRFGLLQVGEMQRRIREGIDPPLEQSTIDAKGSDTPLIDTGEGWTSIRHRVEKG
jgi:hypothetical protein